MGAYRSKMKSPLEMVASAVRAANGDVDFAFALANQVAQLGEPLYRKHGAHRLFQCQPGVDELGRPAGAHEFRAATGRQQGAGRESGMADAKPELDEGIRWVRRSFRSIRGGSVSRERQSDC